MFGLTGTSPEQTSDAAGPDLASVGARHDDGVVQFAIATYDRRATPLYPARFRIDIDATGDGEVDRVVYNDEAGGFGASGQDVVFVQLAGSTAPATAYYASIADFNASTTVFTVPLAALGATAGAPLTMTYTVSAIDTQGTGLVTDTIADNVWTAGPGVPAPVVVADGSSLVVPAGGNVRFTVQATGAPPPSSATGLLVLQAADALADFQTVVVAGEVTGGHDPGRLAGAGAGRGHHSRRRSAAHAVSSWRFESCSLRSTAETWVSTVFTDRIQPGPDLLVGVAPGDEAHDLLLAGRQLVELGVDRVGQGPAEGVEHEAGQAGREHGVAAVHPHASRRPVRRRRWSW